MGSGDNSMNTISPIAGFGTMQFNEFHAFQMNESDEELDSIFCGYSNCFALNKTKKSFFAWYFKL